MNNGRPISRKQTIRLMLALTILAWATQVLFQQWSFGAQPADERFVPRDTRAGVATLELRSEATIVGGEVRLKQVCRWAETDKAVFDPIAELVLFRIDDSHPFKSIDLSDLKRTLHDAGVNLASINVVGVHRCTVSRSDVDYDEQQALQQWVDARQGNTGGPTPDSPATQPQIVTLRSKLLDELTTRLQVPAEALQVTFRTEDDRVLNLSEPIFRFDIEAGRARALGRTSWNVTLVGAGDSRKVMITADVKAWQVQLVVQKPLAFKQMIQPGDVAEQRVLVDQLSTDPLATAEQTIGQQAARELKPGTILTGKMLDPVPLARPGQLVTVTVSTGSVQIKTVARALESGTLGQTIKVKKDSTRDVFDVILTGPQTATMGTPADGMPVADTGR